ncbi:hypothetical protein MPSEU_000637700 [Mayamaea pseudoterrestris]|nr:hypothetical protein MPSEU_000637700 [Mayamaea pseudoterrestris]
MVAVWKKSSRALRLLMTFSQIIRTQSLLATRSSRLHLVRPLSMSSAAQSNEKILVLGGTGFLGQEICRRATAKGYAVTSLSRRGLPPPANAKTNGQTTLDVDYRQGDACDIDSIRNVLDEGNYKAVIHCIGLLFDDSSGLGDYNVFVSGSGSVPDKGSTYDSITRLTAFNAIDATKAYAERNGDMEFPFVFTSAAEAGWPDVTFGQGIEQYLAPEWLRRYLKAKREVENKLMSSEPTLRPVILRPSLIYSMDRPASLLPVGAFFVGNKVGLPFVDRPVTVSSLASAMLQAVMRLDTKGVLRYPDIDRLGSM